MDDLKPWSKNKPDLFCEDCRLLHRWCYCSQVEMVNLDTRFHVIVHHRDWSMSSNSVNLARKVIPNCDIHLRGLKGHPIDWMNLDIDPKRAFYLYPCEDSIPITDIPKSDAPIHLIVPDGSWNQARKFKKREPFLHQFQSVHIPFSRPSRYFLRREKREEHLCTYEAMAMAVGILESKEKESRLLAQLELMVEHTLKSRAKKLALQEFYKYRTNDLIKEDHLTV